MIQKVVFKELYLLSRIEKSAKKVVFHPKTTVIIGINDTGKSSLIKSIYHTLGADVYSHKNWESINVIGLLKFSIVNKDYFILRYQDIFAVFSEDGVLLKTAKGISSKIGIKKYLAELFSFNLQLKLNQNSSISLAPPAFQYLPFYIDQDKGWKDLWSSFEGLQQFTAWRRDLIDYHAGIKPKEYYTLTAKISEMKSSLNALDSEIRITKNTQQKFEEKQHGPLFDVDIELYKKEINRLVEKCNTLNIEQEKYRNELNTLKNQEAMLLHQQDIARKSLSEIEKDYKYLLKDLTGDHVECPICGTTFENSLIHRFSLVEDSESCQEVIIDIANEITNTKEKIGKIDAKYFKNHDLISTLQKLLESKKEEMSLSDIIKSASRKEVSTTFNESIDEYEKQKLDLQKEVDELTKKRKKYLDKEYTTKIKDSFKTYMTGLLTKLSVYGLKEEDYKDIPPSIKETGSDHPRALLAYFYSYLYTMLNYSSSTIFPIIIDSPNQQDQDKKNLLKMMDIALNEKPEGCQLILGSVDLYGVDYNGAIIKLENEHHLLTTNEYEEVNNFMSPFFNRAIYDFDSQNKKDKTDSTK